MTNGSGGGHGSLNSQLTLSLMIAACRPFVESLMNATRHIARETTNGLSKQANTYEYS